ncbi:unnamed protein product [Paramecium primaurelia]|uniref:Uncharacterized protein n=1 Tax=Paramecium primaurelia TaxID=5886 RepID=A0A8S1QDM3_PARPR|nr:unnamed protein product [Paramecium primaurelia]
MKYLPLVILLLCLTAYSRVESVQELLEQTKDQYHLEQDFDTLKSMFEAELNTKKEKETSNQPLAFAKDDSISQSILLAKVKKSQYNSTNGTYPNSTYNYTYQSSFTQYPVYNNSSNSSNNTNNTNGSYSYSNQTYNYTYPSTSNSSSNSSTYYNTTNQTSSINYTNGSSNYNNTRNNRYIPSRLQLRVRNYPNLRQGQLKNNTQNVTFYNSSSGTYEYVVIYNNTEIYENQTDTFYYYYQNTTLITLERQFDDYGNVIYRNFNLNYSLIVASNTSYSSFNNQQLAFGTLVLTNETFSGQYNRQGNSNGYIYSNDSNNQQSYNQNNQFNGQAQYSNQIGNYSFSSSDYGGSSNYQQNGSQTYQDQFNFNDYNYGYAAVDINQNTSNRYQSSSQSNNGYSQTGNQIQGNNTSAFQNQNQQTYDYRSQSSSQYRTNETFSNTQSTYASSQSAQSNSTIINHDGYSAGNTNQRNSQLETSYSNSSSNNYNSNSGSLNYNYTLTDTNGNYIENSTNSSGGSNTSFVNLSGNEQRNVYDYDNQTFSYSYGSNQGTINNTNSQFTSGPNTTVTIIDSQVTTANSQNYQNNEDPVDISGQSQTTHSQSTIEQSRQQFNQLRGSKKQASGSWKQVEAEELQQSNSIIIEQAINEINTKFNPLQFGYQFDSIISVQEQIVSGINYKIYLSYLNPEFEQQIYEVIIYSIPWQNKSNQVIKSIRFDQFEN